MTKQEFAQLNKPSQLIRVAVKDARKLDREIYKPHANLFHSPVFGDGNSAFQRKKFKECYVCDAGAVIAGTLGAGKKSDKFPSKYSDAICKRLRAIDNLRTGDLYSACRHLWGGNFDTMQVRELEAKLGMPDWFSFIGWDEMDEHLESLESYADDLEKAGY